MFESSWFHGTRSNDDIEEFLAMSHFGDLDTAKMTCANKKYKDKVQGDAWIIEVSLNLKSEEVLAFKDIGSPNAIAFAYYLLDSKEKYNFSKDFIADLTDAWKQEKSKKAQIARHNYGEKEKAEARKEVSKILVKHGYKAYSYVNDVESNNKAISVCIFDPSVVDILTRKKLSEEEALLFWNKSKRNT
ncbi:hypothetical protein [Vibrio harveyi]|uniref:hypothetical protein n=1 Tax=Vibrio harveyi TaxID=669 RepID=UPI000D784A17|nr:hypothetical protein [Vibrio harveyi]GBK97673.1 hypothetical protein VH1709_contig00011-0001 [Vibrio harveyi]HDM8061631.1 hypothetical protein [Vibrio harveyi]